MEPAPDPSQTRARTDPEPCRKSDQPRFCSLCWLLLLLAILASMIMAWGWLIWRLLTRQPILPEQPMVARREPTWGSGDGVARSLCFTWLWDSSLLARLRLGDWTWPGASDAGRRLSRTTVQPIAAEKQRQHDPKADEPTFAMTEMMFVNAVAQVVMLVLVPLVLRWTSGARLHDLGLSWSGWWRQAAVGVVAMLITTPVVFLVQSGRFRSGDHVVILWRRCCANISRSMWATLRIVTGVILAPMLEEMTFRAIFQGWLIRWMRRREHSDSTRDTPLELQGREIEDDSCQPTCGVLGGRDRADVFVGDTVTEIRRNLAVPSGRRLS